MVLNEKGVALNPAVFMGHGGQCVKFSRHSGMRESNIHLHLKHFKCKD